VRAWREDSPFFTLMMLPGPFAELAYLSGLEQFLVGTRRDPGATRRLAEGMVDYALVLAERAFLAGAQGFLIGEDLAWDRGLFLRRETYAELFLPALHRQRATLRSLGLPVLLHSDGAFGDLLEDLAEVGLDGLHGLQPSAGIELGALKARFGDRWCLWGNLELDVIAAATPRILEQTVSETLRVGAATPGFIFGSSAGVLGADLPAERVRATYDLARALAEAGPSPISGNC
jgi:uroporphyrinogen decarboxylase